MTLDSEHQSCTWQQRTNFHDFVKDNILVRGQASDPHTSSGTEWIQEFAGNGADMRVRLSRLGIGT